MNPAELTAGAGLTDEELAALTPEEYQVLVQMVREFGDEGGEATILPAITDLEYETPPVDVLTWLEDPYYMGAIGKDLYPKLKQDFVELFGGSYNECIMSGAIGYGKTTFASLGLLRVIYQLLCMRNPQQSFGLSVDTTISFVCVCVLLNLAKKVVFSNVCQKVVQSPFFMENFRPIVTATDLRFPKNITVAPIASSDKTILGLNAYGGIIDEGNFIGEATQNQKIEMRRFGVLDKAELLYTGLKQRMQSRYMQRGGRLPGMLFVLSSKRTVNDFVERRLREVRQRGEPTVFVREYAQWEVNPDNYGTKRFWIVVGNDQLRSRILGPDEDPNQFRNISGVQIVAIPEEFRQSFTKDFDAAVRDIAGLATIAISPFITRQDKIQDAVDHTYTHPFSVYEWEAGTLGHFNWEKIVRIGTSGERHPICCPKAPRYAHIDGSLRMDCTGIAVGHIHGWKDVERDDHAGSKFTEQSPIIKMDFVLRVTPPVGQDIALADVRGLIYNMAEHGVSIVHVSMDSFQSAESLQQFMLKGYKAEVISVDRANIPYELLKAALYEDRLIIYDYKPLTDELSRLEYDRRRGKVDHPKGSCFVGDTRIPLLDGSLPTIAELVGKEAWVYSALPNGTIVPGRARGRQTKMVSEFVDVVLDSGAVERCTPEHLWMLRDGTYKEARNLRPGIDRLMPILRIWPRNGGYEEVRDKNARRTMTHRMVWSFFNGPIPDGHLVHHLDHEKTNNLPENLVAEPASHHAHYHTSRRHATDPAWREKLYAGLQRFNESDDGRRKHAEAMRRTALSTSVDEFKRRAKLRQAFRSDIDLPALEAVKSDTEATNANSVARILGCGRNVVVRVLRESGHASWEAFAKTETGVNHKIRAVIPVRLSEPVPVYDLEVDKFSNFALASGVFVHNSKDVSDAVAGVIFCLSISRQASIAGLSPDVTAPSLGISESPEIDPQVVQGPLGQQTLTEDWDSDFKSDSDVGNGIIVAPPWLMASKPTVPTLPLQRDVRRRN